MPCRQIFSTRLPNGTTAINYLSPTLAYTWNTSATPGAPWQTAGTFKNVTISHGSAPGSGKSFVYTFVKNGVDTALVVTVADLATSGTSGVLEVAVVAGDVVYWKRTTTGTPTLSVQQARGEFWGTVANESAYGGIGAFSTTNTHRTALFNQGQWQTGTITAGNFEVVAAAGNLTAIGVALAAAPGAGKSYAISLYKNAVKQDGTGGTVNTTITIADSATSGSWTGTVALVAGDYVTLEAVPTGTPAAGSTVMGCGVKFVATTDGESQGGSQVLGLALPTTGGPYYASPNQYCPNAAGAWTATESGILAILPGAITVRALQVRLGVGTVSTGPITFTVRKNGADTVVTATLTSGQQTGSDLTHSVDLAAADTWSLGYTLTATPGAARIANLNFVIYALITIEECVFVTTTRTDRAVFSDRAAIGTLVLPVDSVLSLGELPARTAGELLLSIDDDGQVTAGPLDAVDITGLGPTWLAVSLGGSRAASLPLAAGTYDLINAEPAFTVPTMDLATARIVADVRSMDTTVNITPRLVNASTLAVAGTGAACTASNDDYTGTNQHQTVSVTLTAGQTYKAQATVAGAGAATYATFCTIRLEIG